MDITLRSDSSIRAILVGAYLFSVPAFGFSDSLGLLFIPQSLGMIIAAYALLDVLKNFRIDIPREIGFYALMAFWAVVTFAFATSTDTVETQRLGTLVKVAVATLACAQLIKDEKDLDTALRIFLVSSIVFYFLNRNDIRDLQATSTIVENERFEGTAGNANFAANYALTIIWASVFLLLKARRKGLTGALIAIPVAISLLTIYYSGSKKGFAGMALFSLFFARLLYMRQRSSLPKKSLVVLFSLALVVAVGYFIYTSPFFFRMQDTLSGGSNSDEIRFELMNEAAQTWLSNAKTMLMGVGYDNFKLVNSFGTYAHSTPFELLASNGFVGLALFVAFLVLIFRRFLSLYRTAADAVSGSVYFVTMIFIGLYGLFMLAEPLQDSRELLPLMGCLAAFGRYRALASPVEEPGGEPAAVSP